MDRRATCCSPDRSPGGPDAGRNDSGGRRGGGGHAPCPRGVHGGEGGRERRDGRLPARVPPCGASRPGGRLYRRVQHARNPGHHDGRWARPGGQRPGVIANRDEQRRECPRPGEPCQRHHRAGRSVGGPQRRRRGARRHRPGHPRQYGQVGVLLRRGRGGQSVDHLVRGSWLRPVPGCGDGLLR